MPTIYNKGTKKAPRYYVIYDDINENAKRKRKWISVRKYLGLKRRATHEEAVQVKKEIEDRLASNDFVEPNYQTVKEFFDFWLDAQKVDVSPATFDKYSIYVRCHYIPFFGESTKIRSIKPQHIAKFKAHLLRPKEEGGLAPETAKSILNTLSTALDQAGLPKNPCKHKIKKKNISNVKIPKTTVKTLDELGVKKLRNKLRKHTNVRNYVLTMTALSTGMRSGELCALTWPDVDFKRKTISVNGAMKRKGSSFYKAPYAKSDRSLRTIDITKKDIELLKELKEQQKQDMQKKLEKGRIYKKDNYVFANRDGSPLTPMRITHVWDQLRKKLGVAVTFRGLRHTCATLWIKNGVPINVVAQRLGHTEETITWRYGHVQAGMQREAAEKMSKILE